VSISRWLRVVFCLVVVCSWSAQAAGVWTLPALMEAGRVSLYVGQSVVIEVSDAVRVAVAEPKIADVAAISRTEVLVSARVAGTTTLHIWDDTGISSLLVRVSENNEDLVTELKSRLKLPGVEPWMRGDSVVLEGWVESSAQKERAVQVAAVYGKVVDLLTVSESAATADDAETSVEDASGPWSVEVFRVVEREVVELEN
jgi:Flp pilus assembly secretin CpaC